MQFLGSFLERVGGMVVHPRRTLKELLGSSEGGLGDMSLVLLLHLAAGSSRVGNHGPDSSLSLARALMYLGRFEPLLAVQGIFQAVSGLLPEILGIAFGAVALAIFAGRRSGGRELDLAAMTWVPAVLVKTVAALLFTALGRDPSAVEQQAVDYLSLGWAAALWSVALWLMRAERERVEAR